MNCIICEKKIEGKGLHFLGNVYCSRTCASEGGDYTHEYEKEELDDPMGYWHGENK